MASPRSQSPPLQNRRGSLDSTRGRSGSDLSGAPTTPKKFLNGWTKEQETLMAEWADIASCYRWLHDRSEKVFSRSNMSMTIPVIILSTLTGTANFAIDSFVPAGDESLKKYVSAGIGGFSILAGILTTLGNFFQFAQKSEAHKVASIAWGKFQRQLTVELAIHPDERIEGMDFLKMCRQDLDRLIEQSPPIPDAIIRAFEKEFKSVPNLKVPDICHGIEHTRVYDATKPRLSKLTAEAVLHLKYKKNALANSILPDIDKKVELELSSRIEDRIQTILAARAAAATTAATAATPPSTPNASSEKEQGPLPKTDWRKLLIKQHNTSLRALSISTPAPAPAEGPTGPTGPMPIVDAVHIDIVGQNEIIESAVTGPAANEPTLNEDSQRIYTPL